ncbi:MAG: hypothetical protein J6B23_09020 [Clostridia bacterium]|nr:hypothetical protein [Clostridia bacterium]
MPDVHFFGLDVEHISRVPKCNTHWTIYYNDIGNFECHMSLANEFVPIAIERLQSQRPFIARQDGQTAIIIGYDANKDFCLYGRTCNWIMTKRITHKFAEVSDTPVALARKFVSDAFPDSFFSLGSTISTTNKISYAKDNMSRTFDCVKEVLDQKKYGHNVVVDVDRKKWYFNIIAGRELTLVLSEANRQAYDCRLTYDMLDVATCGYYNKEVTVTDEEGNESTETEVAYISGIKTGLSRWEGILSGSTLGEASAELQKMKANDSSAFSTVSLAYGVDYNLGDIIKTQIVKGAYRATIRKRVTGIELFFNEQGKSEKPIFENEE